MLNHVDPEAGNRGVRNGSHQEDEGHSHAQIEEKLPHLADSMAEWVLSKVPENFSSEGEGEEDVPADIEVHLGQFTHEIVICERLALGHSERTLANRVT